MRGWIIDDLVLRVAPYKKETKLRMNGMATGHEMWSGEIIKSQMPLFDHIADAMVWAEENAVGPCTMYAGSWRDSDYYVCRITIAPRWSFRAHEPGRYLRERIQFMPVQDIPLPVPPVWKVEAWRQFKQTPSPNGAFGYREVTRNGIVVTPTPESMIEPAWAVKE